MINEGRQLVSDSLTTVVLDLFGKNDVSEQSMKDAWLEEISGRNRLTYNGWYSPPDNGMAILTSRGDDMQRTHFKSFRDPRFYASQETIDWHNCSIIAYASNVDRISGLPADFATTMYFGDRKDVKKHLQDSVSACQALLSELNEMTVAKDLYLRMEDILAEHEIDGRTWSSTDNDYNFGHTLPLLDVEQGLTELPNSEGRMVTNSGAEGMRTKRIFLSSESDLELASGIQFTVEPQCVSRRKKGLPKVMMHYVVQFLGGKFHICDACDDLPSRFGMA